MKAAPFFRCPQCGMDAFYTLDGSRYDGGLIWRRKRCRTCGYTTATFEGMATGRYARLAALIARPQTPSRKRKHRRMYDPLPGFPCLTVEQVAEATGRSAQLIRRWAREASIEAYRIPSGWLIDPTMVERIKGRPTEAENRREWAEREHSQEWRDRERSLAWAREQGVTT